MRCRSRQLAIKPDRFSQHYLWRRRRAPLLGRQKVPRRAQRDWHRFRCPLQYTCPVSLHRHTRRHSNRFTLGWSPGSQVAALCLPSRLWPVVSDKRSPLTVAGAAAASGPVLGHPSPRSHFIPWRLCSSQRTERTTCGGGKLLGQAGLRRNEDRLRLVPAGKVVNILWITPPIPPNGRNVR